MSKDIKTPFGKIIPEVSLFPIYYLLFMYGFVYIFPYGKNLVGVSWFDWFRSEDGPLEWLQFSEYLVSSFFALIIFIRSNRKSSLNTLLWLVFLYMSISHCRRRD